MRLMHSCIETRIVNFFSAQPVGISELKATGLMHSCLETPFFSAQPVGISELKATSLVDLDGLL